ncbi:MAG TPA: ATP-binding protein [Streptosporangiaceae bacterium]|nr:ATP-binding protein [Streptosporangiaceae bacterium]
MRLQLTLLYGGLFVLSGAALLGTTYVLVEHRLPVVASAHSTTGSGGTVNEVCATGPGGGTGGTGPGASGVLGTSGGLGTSSGLGSSAGLGTSGSQAPAAGCAGLMQTMSRQRSAELEQLLVVSGIALAIMSVVAIGLGWLMSGRVLRPLRSITAAARRVSASNLHHRLALHGPDDELRELGETFNGLLSRLEGAFGAQRQFVANASHELRTPLARQRTLLEVALADPARSAGSLQAACERVLAAGEQQERLIEALLTLARSQRGLDRREDVDLRAAAAEALQAHSPEARRRDLRVHTSLQPARTAGDPGLAERLAANLVDNAVRYGSAGGWIEVSTGLRGGSAVLSVTNSGPVIPPAEVGRLFQPFQRLGAERTGVRGGQGLGLSIVAAIAAAHDARLSAHALPAGGLAVELWFPPALADRRPALAAAAACT